MGDQLYLVMEKLHIMRKYIDELEAVGQLSYEEYQNDSLKRYAIERLIQLIVDLAVDINNLILAHLKQPASRDYFNSFIELGEADVLPVEFAVSMAPCTGMRNRLVHQYESIDSEIIYRSIPKTIDNFGKYMKYIDQYVR